MQVRPVEADLRIPNTLRNLPLIDDVFYLAGPDGRTDGQYRAIYVDGLRYLLGALRQQGQSVRRFFLASSTSVYAQHDGEWVDEESATAPTDFSGRAVLEGEELVRKNAARWPVTIVRFAGIYGPGRTRLLQSVLDGKATYPAGGPAFTNRIHRDDCARVLVHLMERRKVDELYLATDDDPAEGRIVHQWLASELHAPPPRAVTDETGAHSSNKRCCNERLKETGFTFRYPTFREGYASFMSRAK